MNWRDPKSIREYARDKANKRPKSTTPEGRALSTYLGKNTELQAELKQLRPDWFNSAPTLSVADIQIPDRSEATVIQVFTQSTRSRPYRQSYHNKVAFLKALLAGESRPNDALLTKYLHQDPAFRKVVELLDPDWLRHKRSYKPVHGPVVEGAALLKGSRRRPNQKISDDDYAEILRVYTENKAVRGIKSRLAREYGVTPACITRLLKRAFPEE